MNVPKRDSAIHLIAELMQMNTEDVRRLEAVLQGLREEGVLEGTRLHWRFTGARGLCSDEAEALVYVTHLAHALESLGYEMVWQVTP